MAEEMFMDDFTETKIQDLPNWMIKSEINCWPEPDDIVG